MSKEQPYSGRAAPQPSAPVDDSEQQAAIPTATLVYVQPNRSTTSGPPAASMQQDGWKQPAANSGPQQRQTMTAEPWMPTTAYPLSIPLRVPSDEFPPPPQQQLMYDEKGNETMCSTIPTALLVLPCFWPHLCLFMPCICTSHAMDIHDVQLRARELEGKLLFKKKPKLRLDHPDTIECDGENWLFNPVLPADLQQLLSADMYRTIITDIKQQLLINPEIGNRNRTMDVNKTKQYRLQKLEYYKDRLIAAYNHINIQITLMAPTLVYIRVKQQPQSLPAYSPSDTAMQPPPYIHHDPSKY